MKKLSVSGVLLILSYPCYSQLPSKPVPEAVIIAIPFKGPQTAFPKASAKDRLLWYTGKKINDSILLTPEANLVLYSEKRNLVAFKAPEGKDPAKKIIAELSKTEQRKSQVYEQLSKHKSSVMLYPFIIATFNEFDKLTEGYGMISRNAINLPPSLPATAYMSLHKGGAAFNDDDFGNAAIPVYIRRAYEEVMASMKNYPPLDFPAPPSREFGSCFDHCDTSASARQSRNEDDWLKKFIEYEAGIVQRSQSIFTKN